MKRDYDVIVVGAGPAGATAALCAARRGLSVLLADKRRFPRDKVCGDAVARKPLRYLRALGLMDRVLAEVHESIGAVVLGAPNGTTVEIDLTESPPGGGALAGVGAAETAPGGETVRPYIVCRREALDGVLFEAAAREVDAREGRAVTGLLADDGAVCGVQSEAGEFTAGVVIGADGYDSVVARELGLYRHDASRWYAATRAYYMGLDCRPHTAEVHFVDQTLPGFLWIFPCGGGLANVGLGMIAGDLKRRRVSLREVHETILALPRFRARFARAERIGGIHGWTLPTPDFSRTLCGPGFLLAGDAAGLVDPFTGEGIGNAMASGWVAAGVAARAARRGDFAADSLSDYPRRLWARLDPSELRLHYRLRSLARRRWLIDFLIGRAARRQDTLEWLAGMTARDGALSRKRALTSPLAYLRRLFR